MRRIFRACVRCGIGPLSGRALFLHKCPLSKPRGQGKSSIAKAVARQKWSDQNTEKVRAHRLVTNARKRGDLRVQPQPCGQCGETQNVHGHHEDYSKPFDLTWLCSPCHRKLHAAEKPTLSTHQKHEISSRRSSGERAAALAAEFKVSESTIYRVR